MDKLENLQQKRSELNSINITNERAVKELREYDDIWFRSIAPYLFHKPFKHNLIELNIKRYKLVLKLNRIIELLPQHYISKISNKTLCNVCNSNLIYVAKGKVYCEKCDANDDIIVNKRGIYSPKKHFRNWLDYIMGREDDIQAKDLNQLKTDIINILNDKNIDVNKINVYDIRRCLKLCKATKYNKHLTTLYREITDKQTPTICLETEAILLKHFDMIILVLDRCNIRFYPYYIYKLIEVFGLDKDKEVLKFIYLQSIKTLSERDKRWKEICKKINVRFIPSL